MAMEQRLFRQRTERQVQLAVLALAGEKLLEQKCIRRQRVRRLALEQGRQFIAKSKQAAWLEAYNRQPPCDIGCEGVQRALNFTPRFVDQAN